MFRLDLGKYSTNGGSLSPSLAAILYQTSLGDFVYQTDSNGNVVLDNQGTLTSAYDGLPYSGRGIELGALNDVDIPTHHTLGSELVTNGTFDADTNWTKGTGWTIATGVASSDGTQVADSLLTTSTIPTTVAEGTYLISFEVTAYTAGNVALQFDGIEIIPDKAAVGVYSAEAIASDTTGTVDIVADLNFVGSVDNVTVKQITNPNSYLTYYDFTDGLVTLGNSVDGGSSKEYITNGGFDGNADGWSLTGTAYYSNGIVGINSPLGESADIQQSSGLTAGRTYLVTMTANITSGQVLFNMGESIEITNGTNTYVVTASDTFFKFKRGAGSVIATFDNVSVKEILPISTKYTLNTKTINNVITHTTPWSASDWARINNNPNLIGKLALETLGATKTIPELDMVMDAGASADSYYMCSEKSGAYLVDSRVAYGSNLVTDSTFDVPASWTVSGAVVSGGVCTFSGNSQTLSQGASPTVGSYYKVSYDVTVSNFVGLLNLSSAGLTGITIPIPTTLGSHSIIVKCVQDTSEDIRLITTNYVSGTVSIDNLLYLEATATEIATYAETIRTNADLQQKGIQTTAFVTDGAGVPTAYSNNLLQFNGDGRYVYPQLGAMVTGNTGEYVYEVAMTYDGNNAQYQLVGQTISPQFRFGFSPTSQKFAQLAGVNLATGTTTDGTTILFAVYVNEDTNFIEIFLNGISATSGTGTKASTSTMFTIGRSSTSSSIYQYPLTKPIGHFRILKGTSASNYDALQAYNEYIA